MNIWQVFHHSFPIKLFLMHVKYNQFLLLYWFLLFAIVGGAFGGSLGIPYLFLDPIYLDRVGFWGFFIIGISLAGFTMAFHITSYIMDGFRFPFLGTLPRPFAHFCLNNSLLPLAFLTYYIVKICQYQNQAALYSLNEMFFSLAGLILGMGVMFLLFFLYFTTTNRDIKRVLERTQKTINPTSKQKRNAFRRLRKLKRKPIRCLNYLSLKGSFHSTRRFEKNYDRIAILGIFRQNQRNAIFIEVLLLASIFGLGLLQNTPIFQIPAAASSVLLLTIIVMTSGALSYWLRSWVISAVLLLLLISNVLFTRYDLGFQYPAFGLDYSVGSTTYNLEHLKAISSPAQVESAKEYWLQMLENWKANTGEAKPELIFITVSGGGQRSALWTTHVLQQADSMLHGSLMDKTFMITGASGGLIGAAFYRDLYWQKKNRFDKRHLASVGKELLNPLIFKLLVNDIFIKLQSFEYAGQRYKKERGYTFEEELSSNLEGTLDHAISEYRQPEFSGEIPVLLVSPLITNDGRKLYISPHPMAFMNDVSETNASFPSVDFRALLKKHQPDSLRFLTALRMSATFPYVVPTITLPTNPPIQIADAGISDNYGISDALIFLQVFKEWLMENTSQVTMFTIRDSPKLEELKVAKPQNILQQLFSPIQSVYKSWDKVQSTKNDQWYDLSKETFGDHLRRVEIEYKNLPLERVSLNWRLTEAEKWSLMQAIDSDFNQKALQKLSR